MHRLKLEQSQINCMNSPSKKSQKCKQLLENVLAIKQLLAEVIACNIFHSVCHGDSSVCHILFNEYADLDDDLFGMVIDCLVEDFQFFYQECVKKYPDFKNKFFILYVETVLTLEDLCQATQDEDSESEKSSHSECFLKDLKSKKLFPNEASEYLEMYKVMDDALDLDDMPPLDKPSVDLWVQPPCSLGQSFSDQMAQKNNFIERFFSKSVQYRSRQKNSEQDLDLRQQRMNVNTVASSKRSGNKLTTVDNQLSILSSMDVASIDRIVRSVVQTPSSKSITELLDLNPQWTEAVQYFHLIYQQSVFKPEPHRNLDRSCMDQLSVDQQCAVMLLVRAHCLLRGSGFGSVLEEHITIESANLMLRQAKKLCSAPGHSMQFEPSRWVLMAINHELFYAEMLDCIVCTHSKSSMNITKSNVPHKKSNTQATMVDLAKKSSQLIHHICLSNVQWKNSNVTLPLETFVDMSLSQELVMLASCILLANHMSEVVYDENCGVLPSWSTQPLLNVRHFGILGPIEILRVVMELHSQLKLLLLTEDSLTITAPNKETVHLHGIIREIKHLVGFFFQSISGDSATVGMEPADSAKNAYSELSADVTELMLGFMLCSRTTDFKRNLATENVCSLMVTILYQSLQSAFPQRLASSTCIWLDSVLLEPPKAEASLPSCPASPDAQMDEGGPPKLQIEEANSPSAGKEEDSSQTANAQLDFQVCADFLLKLVDIGLQCCPGHFDWNIYRVELLLAKATTIVESSDPVVSCETSAMKSAELSETPKTITSAKVDLGVVHCQYILKQLLEAIVSASAHFTRPLPPSVLNNRVVSLMVYCCQQLGWVADAVLLCQLVPCGEMVECAVRLADGQLCGQPPMLGQLYNVASMGPAGVCIDNNLDGVIEDIWDIGLLEKLVVLETQRGALTKQAKYISCIQKPELNRNNPPEMMRILIEKRKLELLRKLAQKHL